MEDLVGGWWDKLIRRTAYRGYPQAAVALAQIEKQAPLFFRAMGGDPALTLRTAVGTAHGARRRLLERIAGTGEQVELAWRDGQSLYLPERIDLFPDAAHNRELYFWLMALAAQPQHGDDGDWLTRNRRATAACLAAMPGLAALYQRLVTALLPLRDTPRDAAAAAQEVAIRQALLQPEAAIVLPPCRTPPQPVLLWLHPTPPTAPTAGADDKQTPEMEDSDSKETKKKRRYRARRDTADERKNGMLLVFRAESIFTWDEYVRVNRHTDDDDMDDAGAAAEDMNTLTISRDNRRRASRLKFDLDLPAAAYDDTPLGSGILLPEWDYKRQRLVAEHCCLKPMLPRDATPAPLPDKLQPLARRLRRQFQALSPERTRKSGEASGPDIDLDRLIRFLAEKRSGVAVAEPALYQAWPPGGRNMACLLLADLSLSTESWLGEAGQVIGVIRDSLLLFAEALSACGDAFGLYGFSSIRRDEVRYLLLKDFAERYDDTTRGRILALRPGYYTRMGAAIRQSTRILLEQPAQRRLLLIVSDGKPNDLDHYEGRYGVEDTRQAVLEAKRAGLIPFCVTVDKEAGEYLPHLFGRRGYSVVHDARRLPQVLTSLYASLTA
ncbi:nitric oxide reductase [Vogesella sp. EB]|uniref:nitric oxide reductase activation protein NorD n=1 Tax=Vogesella sp. EB TaxID=1526735 RepID=UPI00064D6B87|nr:nitric oxide reductase [Vogesella sp. EB]KMJ53020.1 nitric oxide reductase [Vogesella sp. EB]